MTETEFRKLLNKLDGYFIPRQIGSTAKEWITAGSLLGETSIADIKRILSKEPINCHFSELGDDIRIHVSNHDSVILRIPNISKTHQILFILTVITTLMAGAVMQGGQPLTNPEEILIGIPFSLTLLLILGCHEFGHYYYAQKHKVDATLPYFLPAPPFLFIIGTFGAFIKIKSPIYKKDALLQIGAAGPIAGFVIAVPALIIGLMLSEIITIDGGEAGIILGDSLLMKFLTVMVFPNLADGQDVLLHPIAFAGWIGLLVTMLNLLPIGQLDGGHIAYAMLGERQGLVGRIALLALLPLSLLSLNWLVWGILIIVLMRTAKHPPIQDLHTPLSRENKQVGYACLVIFILCFIPTPFQI